MLITRFLKSPLAAAAASLGSPQLRDRSPSPSISVHYTPPLIPKDVDEDHPLDMCSQQEHVMEYINALGLFQTSPREDNTHSTPSCTEEETPEELKIRSLLEALERSNAHAEEQRQKYVLSELARNSLQIGLNDANSKLQLLADSVPKKVYEERMSELRFAKRTAEDAQKALELRVKTLEEGIKDARGRPACTIGGLGIYLVTKPVPFVDSFEQNLRRLLLRLEDIIDYATALQGRLQLLRSSDGSSLTAYAMRFPFVQTAVGVFRLTSRIFNALTKYRTWEKRNDEIHVPPPSSTSNGGIPTPASSPVPLYRRRASSPPDYPAASSP